MKIVSRERLEALLNEAARIYDAPDMAQVAEHLVKNNVVVLPCAVGDEIYVVRDGKVERQRVLGVKVGLCGTLIQVSRDDEDFDYYYAHEIGKRLFFDAGEAEMQLRRKGGAE